ncbi:MAG: hypothetical protein Fur0032_08500 [Terrimicrobiaceae bacterium]
MLMRVMDEIYMKDPCIGSRRLVTVLERDHGIKANRKRIQRLRREMGIETIWCRPRRTSLPDHGHRKYPYLLRDRVVSRADEAWCADITYIPMPHGHAYQCAVMDWYSRKVLGWAVSNTMDSALTEKALAEALAHSQSLPEIFNTDQGSQFTSPEWTGRIEALGIEVSMDGKGRWMDNLFIERLWRSLKYEDIYLKGYTTVGELEAGVREWIERYNTWRPHQTLNNQTPARVYEGDRKPATSAAEMKKAA